MTRFRTATRVAAVVVAALACAAPAPATADDGWLPTGQGIVSGVSGLAVAGSDPAVVDLLAVHDNKHPGEQRVSRIRLVPGGVPEVEPLRWEGADPVDLEALAEVPGRADEFVAFESSGRGFHLRLRPGAVTVVREFTVPGAREAGHHDNYEGFALVRRWGRTAAVWAHRGQDEEPAVVRSALVDWATLTFGPPESRTVTVPYPAEHVRHISDIEITATGEVLTSAASDPGDDGPFDSGLYAVGRITSSPFTGPGFAPYDTPVALGVRTGHKVEAVACRAGTPTTVLGSDDEHLGGAVRPDGICPGDG
ncbi:hypothetical protein ABT354_36980 [Streptomyces sp. NPDC000594]|uniref:hypothetical protein n=1 Tax=Streptomyces sp. NPDC000594 TaxID=3154261 RepID=UPI003329E99D